jgi:hypothetical protein
LASLLSPLWKRGARGDFKKGSKDRGDMKLPMIYKISPDPSLLKRGIQLAPDIFIVPLWKRGAYYPPFFATLFIMEPSNY